MDEKDLEKLKKIIEAKKDIDKIDEVTRTTYNLQKYANSVYEKTYNKSDYAKFILNEKTKQGLDGNLSFYVLNIDVKKSVLKMVKLAIQKYLLSIANEELQKLKSNTDILEKICKILECNIEDLTCRIVNELKQ